jgi:hypothetical protein
VATAVLLAACQGARPVPVALPDLRADTHSRGEFPDEPRALLRYHSLRFGLTVPLPDGRAWKIDDHKTSALVAEHTPTNSTLTVRRWTEPDVMNRQRCEDRARESGLFSLRDGRTIEDLTTVGPDAYDSRIWVAVESRGPMASLTGHVFLFGAFVRKCLFAHYATEIPSEKEEPLLTSRLAVARLRILAGIQIVAFDEPQRPSEPRP